MASARTDPSALAQVFDLPASSPSPEVDSWPWRCLGCEATIYHDGEFCVDCRSARAAVRDADVEQHSAGFLDWIQGQPYPVFVAKVVAVASFEVLLTLLWLQLLLFGPSSIVGLPGVV